MIICRQVLLSCAQRTEICMYESHQQCRTEEHSRKNIASSRPVRGIDVEQLCTGQGVCVLRGR